MVYCSSNLDTYIMPKIGRPIVISMKKKTNVDSTFTFSFILKANPAHLTVWSGSGTPVSEKQKS